MAGVFSQMGESAQTVELINASRRAQGAYKGQLHQMYAEVMEGQLDLIGGRIYEAHARFRTALAASRVSNPAASSGNAFAALFYALTLYERNQVVQASELLRAHLPLACDIGLPDHMINGYRMLARIAFQAGEVDEAFRLLTELELLGHDRHLPRVIASARLERSRVQMLQGKYQAAQLELQRAVADGTATRTRNQRLTANEMDYEVFAQLRWQAVAGDAGAAAAELGTEIAFAMSAQRRRRVMALRLVRAISLSRSGQDISARTTLEEALKDCHASGIVRMVLDEGPMLGVLVRQLHARATSGNQVLVDAKFVGYLAELLEGWGASLPAPEDGNKAVLLDPLTEKEIHVLHLVSEGYSNVAMAEKLGISDSTIRTHLRNVSSKLAVNSRMQAVVAARRLGILR
jgi:LuxR family maltose regulon positive regulatory protein